MKNMKMAPLFLTILCIITFSLASAQTDYVVTLKGDTLTGKVKYINYGANKSLQILTADKKKTTYPILQTKAFSLDNEMYHTVRSTNGYTYMKVIKKGYLTLYAYQAENQNTWDGRLLRKLDGTELDVPNIGFKKKVEIFLGDCTSIVEKIESGVLTKPKINEIVDEYNACVQNKTSQLIETGTKTTVVSNAWIDLENAMRDSTDFEGRSDALDMVKDIQSKIQKREKLPNFLIDGLKNSLRQQSALKELLEKALADIK